MIAAQIAAVQTSAANDFPASYTTWRKFRDAQEAATGSSEIASNITEVATSADASAHLPGQMGDSVSELAGLSGPVQFGAPRPIGTADRYRTRGATT
ncbi:MAG: hypothetical protein HHJ14_07575 [Cellulomonas sp.]|uniref:hypothetical protein n=1 Tax=Cellulomonas sp. TaxID=40001 RepID=UPI0017A3B8C3|nr:hypothetical protein [Cellulomonas sp.]NMM16994.1 hypothetical protein [Cellulomonas sp.]NMM32321.1 hypothetical protein [Cellulomonas sp.]